MLAKNPLAQQRRLLPARHKRNNCPTADTSMGNQCLRALRYARSGARFRNAPGVLPLLRLTELARYRNAPTSIARVQPIAIVRNSRSTPQRRRRIKMGRVGDGESGRVGEWERGRVGDGENRNSSFILLIND